MKKWMAVMFALALPAGLTLAGETHEHCDHAAHEAAGHGGENHACKAEPGSVTMTGKLLCRHCNLHETDSCEKLFVTDGGERFALCPESDMETLENLAEHGEARLEVEGSLMTHEGGERMLRIEKARAAESR